MTLWRGGVYRPSEKDDFYLAPEWRQRRRRVFRRDKYICLRCDKRFTVDKLSAHHLIPRAEGGSDQMDNLVTLDNACHDFVEIAGLRTRAAIQGSANVEPMADDTPFESDYSKGNDEYHKAWWHRTVYGGCKKKPPK